MEKSVRDNCGVLGLYAKGMCVDEIYQDIDLLQPRGQETEDTLSQLSLPYPEPAFLPPWFR